MPTQIHSSKNKLLKARLNFKNHKTHRIFLIMFILIVNINEVKYKKKYIYTNQHN